MQIYIFAETTKKVQSTYTYRKLLYLLNTYFTLDIFKSYEILRTLWQIWNSHKCIISSLTIAKKFKSCSKMRIWAELPCSTLTKSWRGSDNRRRATNLQFHKFNFANHSFQLLWIVYNLSIFLTFTLSQMFHYVTNTLSSKV